jgi:predicted ester cyclase
MNQMKFYLPILILSIVLSSCENNKVDINKERQNAVEEYKAELETKRKQKLEVIQKFYGVFSTGDMSVLPEILAENYTQYPADPGQTPDIDGFIKHAKDFANMFSDLKGKPSHILIDGDLVFVRSDLEVTHSGTVFGIPATNKRIEIKAFDLHHFNKDGKIDKTWHLEDFWGAYSQIKSK